VGWSAPDAGLTGAIPLLHFRMVRDRPKELSSKREAVMRLSQRITTRVKKLIVVAILLLFSGALVAFSRVAAQTQVKIEATVFAFDGQDFVRTQTTLVTEKGMSAVNTKLDHDTPAYKALIQKRSYSGDVTLFGRKYDANYAPLTGDDGRLTGALFVAVSR
jgi:hypothetical protein